MIRAGVGSRVRVSVRARARALAMVKNGVWALTPLGYPRLQRARALPHSISWVRAEGGLGLEVGL